MNATIKSMKPIKAAGELPAIPAPAQTARRSQLKEIGAFIRSAGGKPMTRATKRRLARARCDGFPED